MAARTRYRHPLLAPFARVALAGALALTTVTAAAEVSGRPGEDYVEGEVLVRFAPQFTARAHRRAVEAVGGRAEAIEGLDVDRVHLPADTSVAEALGRLQRRAEVENAQPNYIYRALETRPNDPQFGQAPQWGLENNGDPINGVSATAGKDMDAPLAWDHITDCSNRNTGELITVAVIDTGLNHRHADFQGNLWTDADGNHGRDFIDGDDDPMPVDGSGHGTHVAGIIGAAGNNGTTVAGVCWQVEIMAIRSLSLTGGGTTITIMQGIDFARNNGADVINMSLGANTSSDPDIEGAVDDAANAGIVMIAAAGNSGGDVDGGTDLIPCELTNPQLVCITALDPNYELPGFANTGETSVDAGAPGAVNASTWPGPIRSGAAGNLAWKFDNDGTTGWGECVNVNTVPVQANPSDRCLDTSASEYDGPDDRVWTDPSGNQTTADHVDFSSPDLLGAGLTARAEVDLEAAPSDDVLVAAADPDGGKPFDDSGSEFEVTRRSAPTGGFERLQGSLVPCVNASSPACTLGFELRTDQDADKGTGVSMSSATVLTVEDGAITGAFLSGTSMATPHAAGVAAMLRAFNPDYTAKDVAAALRGGGEPVAALDGTTVSGDAVNAMGALSFIRKPTGLTANVQ